MNFRKNNKNNRVVALSKTTEQTFQFKLVASALLIVAFLSMAFAWAHKANAQSRPNDFVDLAERLLPSVVNIATVQAIPDEDEGRAIPELPPGSPFREFFEEYQDRQDRNRQNRQPGRSMGSGFFVSVDGYVVTNNHVIGEAEEITVTTADGEEYEAELIGRDASLDIALLKIEGDEEFIPLTFGDSSGVRVGEWVLSIGNPFGLGGSVTAGIVSARNRDINAGPYDDFIQTDASINRGNSGGPLFNMDGEVVGVNTMIFTPNGGNIGIGFSIPSNDVERTVEQLIEYGHPRRGWIGVSIQGVSELMAESLGFDSTNGAVIGSVNEGGPAEDAGLLPGDIIMKFNGVDIGEVRELPRVVAETGVDEEVEVVVWRDGEILTLDITTEERAEDNPVVAEAEEEAEEPEITQGKILGMRLSPLTSSLREQYDIPEDVDGLLVSNLGRESMAAQGGIRPGDLVVQVNHNSVTQLEEMESNIEKVEDAGRKAVLLRIYRGGSYFMVPVSLVEED